MYLEEYVIRWDFKRFNVMAIENQKISSYYLDGFNKFFNKLDNNSYMLLPGYNEPYGDIQYSGVTGTSIYGEQPKHTARREIYEELGLKINYKKIHFLGKFVYNPKKKCNKKTANYFYYVNINDCKPITKNDITSYRGNDNKDNKRVKVNVFVIGNFSDMCSIIKDIKQKIDDGDDISYFAMVTVNTLGKIHQYNTSIIKKKSNNIFTINTFCDVL